MRNLDIPFQVMEPVQDLENRAGSGIPENFLADNFVMVVSNIQSGDSWFSPASCVTGLGHSSRCVMCDSNDAHEWNKAQTCEALTSG